MSVFTERLQPRPLKQAPRRPRERDSDPNAQKGARTPKSHGAERQGRSRRGILPPTSRPSGGPARGNPNTQGPRSPGRGICQTPAAPRSCHRLWRDDPTPRALPAGARFGGRGRGEERRVFHAQLLRLGALRPPKARRGTPGAEAATSPGLPATDPGRHSADSRSPGSPCSPRDAETDRVARHRGGPSTMTGRDAGGGPA